MDSRFSDCSSVSPTHLEDSKVLTASETRKKSTYGGVNLQLPIFEFLFARLSKYVSETESHAILNGIQDEIRFAAPPEYTENDETISIGTLDVDGEPSPPYIQLPTVNRTWTMRRRRPLQMPMTIVVQRENL